MPVHREKTETPQFGLTVQGSAVAGASVVAVQVAPPNPQQAASTSTESTPSISVWADLAPVLEITPQLVLEFDSSASKRREAMLGKFKAFVMLMERKVSKPIPDTEYTSILYQLSLLTEAAEGLDRLALLGIQKFLMFMPWNGTTVKPLFALARDLTILAQSLQAPSLDILYLALNCLRFIAMRLLWSACAGDLVSFFPLNIEQFITQIAGLSAVAERFPDDCFLDVVTSIIITTVSGLNDREGVRSSLLPAVLSSKPNSLAFLRVEALCESLPFAYQTLLILGTRLRADERVAREYMSTMHRLLAAQELPLLLIPAHIHNSANRFIRVSSSDFPPVFPFCSCVLIVLLCSFLSSFALLSFCCHCCAFLLAVLAVVLAECDGSCSAGDSLRNARRGTDECARPLCPRCTHTRQRQCQLLRDCAAFFCACACCAAADTDNRQTAAARNRPHSHSHQEHREQCPRGVRTETGLRRGLCRARLSAPANHPSKAGLSANVGDCLGKDIVA
eukprot:m.270029 g.270029  ORF g.270029 m.270029 type:complete len:506 (-) comp54753_c0_seq3:119-1636(-)